MERKQTIKSLLGTSQIETAMLLDVSMGQYSMFDSGKRGLPTKALELFSEMLSHINDNVANKGIYQTKEAIKHEAEMQQQMKDMLEENQFQLLKTRREIVKVTQKHEENLKALVLAEFKFPKAENQDTELAKTLGIIVSRAVRELRTNGPLLLKLQSKEQALQAQQVWLKERMDAKQL